MMRLNKFLSDQGICSRREADRLIESGRVKVNNSLAQLGQKVDQTDIILIDDKAIKRQQGEKVYIAFNKPVGIVCTTDLREKDNIISYINYPERIFPIGRLDKDSEGLILLTSDGDIVNKVLRAQYNNHKEYEVTTGKELSENDIDKLLEGPVIFNPNKKRHVRANAVYAKKIGPRKIKMILNQGLNRQIRRMLLAIDHEVVKLKRIRIMHIKLGRLPAGSYRHLSKEEVGGLG